MSRATVPISLKEWLSVGCQCIRQAYHYDFKPNRKQAVAMYENNAHMVLFPSCGGEYKPEGPGAFLGEIIVFEMMTKVEMEHQFKCVIEIGRAHV